MSGIFIREINSKEIKAYQEFLNTGLVNDEENFRIAPDDEINASFPTKDLEDSFTLAAFSDTKMAGVVSFEREGSNREKLKHKGILFRMYVSSEFRGCGISSMLIHELLTRVKTVAGIEQINLTVVSTNHKARSLYGKFGFKTFSTEYNALKWKGKYFDEDQMTLSIRRID